MRVNPCNRVSSQLLLGTVQSDVAPDSRQPIRAIRHRVYCHLSEIAAANKRLPTNKTSYIFFCFTFSWRVIKPQWFIFWQICFVPRPLRRVCLPYSLLEPDDWHLIVTQRVRPWPTNWFAVGFFKGANYILDTVESDCYLNWKNKSETCVWMLFLHLIRRFSAAFTRDVINKPESGAVPCAPVCICAGVCGFHRAVHHADRIRGWVRCEKPSDCGWLCRE